MEVWERHVLSGLKVEAGITEPGGSWQDIIIAWVDTQFPNGGASDEERLEKEEKYMAAWAKYKISLEALVP